MKLTRLSWTGVALFVLPSVGAEPAGGAAARSPGLLTATDHAGREWKLEDWPAHEARFPAPSDGAAYRRWLMTATRPYPKNLARREAWYREKNGEDWDGPRHGPRILTPGDWAVQQPPYGYGRRFLPKAEIERLIVEYGRQYASQ
jgi:hypothetical protein